MRCEICNENKEITDYSRGVALCGDCEKEADLDEVIKNKPKMAQKFDVLDESDGKPTFWFYKKGRRHFANQSERHINDFTADCRIPIDNFNYQIDVGLIEDIGSLKD